jgi:phosphate starvation-inducible protein PhoH and related proteins
MVRRSADPGCVPGSAALMQTEHPQPLTKPVPLDGVDERALFGPGDVYIRKVESAFSAELALRDGALRIVSARSDAPLLRRALVELVELLRRKGRLEMADVELTLRLVLAEAPAHASVDGNSIVAHTPSGPLRTRTAGQERLVRAARENLVTFAVGPAGTGKTYLAVAMAVAALVERQVSRIVLTRPAVEAGESLGFLPGDMRMKVDPYLRPLWDGLFDMMEPERMTRLVEQQIVEVAPLAFMRGRTLNNAFIILDEAQNTTPGQMKMFLTRMGQNSRALVTGDITQIDLADPAQSGLVQIRRILRGVKDVAFVELEKADVVRHRLVRDIIHAYEEYEDRASRSVPS